MKWLTVAFLFVSTTIFSQGNFTLTGEYHNTDSIGPGIGGHAMLTKSFAGKLNIGVGVSAIKFDKLQSMYYPVSVHISFFPLGPKRIAPFILAEPGFGIYSHTENYTTTNRYSSKGGFSFFAGAGVQIRVPGLTPTLTAGYSGFTVKTSHSQQSIGVETVTETEKLFGGLGLRLGIMF